jgi:hypothetical protein
MKHRLLVLFLFLVLTSFLTACSAKNAIPAQDATFSPGADQPAQVTPNVTGPLEDFVNAMNNHQVAETLDLFDDSAHLIGVDQINYGLTLDGAYTYSGKAEIEGWLEYQTAAIIKIVPQENTLSTNTLEAVFYYTNHIEYVSMDAQIQAGKFNTLYYYIEKIEKIYE